MVDVDPRFEDVDFSKESPFVFGDLGASCFASSLAFEDVEELIPESQWPAIIEKIEAENTGTENLITRIFDQKQEGSCVANACSQAVEIIQAKQFGKDAVVHLSAISLYKRIGRSPGSGAMVSDGLDEINSRGILPLDTPENREKFGNIVMPNTGFYTPFPSGWESVAANFKGIEANTIRSVGGLITASLRGRPIVVGREGHSICYARPSYSRGRLGCWYPNSWSLQWGQALAGFSGGFGFDTLSQIQKSASWAFALRTVTVPS